MRVLLVGKGPPERGGIAAFLVGLDARLQDRGNEVSLLNLTRASSYRAGRVSAFNITRTFQDVVAVWRTAGRYDVVHINSAFVPAVTMVRAWLLCLAARSRGVPAVLHVHGGRLFGWLGRGPKSWLVRLCLRGVTSVVTASEGLAERLAPFHRRVEFIPNGVDVNRFRPDSSSSEVPVVLYVGVLSPRKGLIDLIKASQRVLDDGVQHRLVLLGGRPDEGDEAESQVREAASSHVEMPGSVPYEEVPQRMAAADVFCLPSWYEAMPLSVLEAMASGLPVIATAVGQIPEVIDAEVGVLVEPKQPEELADALAALLRNPKRRREIGSAARDRAVADFSLGRVVDRVEMVYQAAVTGDQ